MNGYRAASPYMSGWPLGARFLCNRRALFPKNPFGAPSTMSTQHVPFCKCSDPNCPAVAMMRKISAMPTNGDVWSIETVAGFTMATTAAVKNRLDVVQVICCQIGTFENDPSDIAWVYKQAVERHRAAFTVIAFAIFYAGHGEDNYQIFKSLLAPED